MYVVDADPDWYLDHVLLAAGPDGEFVGPARLKLAAWQRQWLDLSDVSAGRHAAEGSTALERAGALAAGQGFVLTYAQTLSCGLDRAYVRRLQRRRAFTAVRRSVLCPLPDLATGAAARAGPIADSAATTRPAAAEPDCVDATDPAVAAAAAVLVRRGSWISHESAALAHGLPVLDAPTRPILTHQQVAATEGRDGLLMHAAPMPPADQASWFGAPITSVTRTVIDIARCSGMGAGLVIADAALRESLTTRRQMADCMARMSCWPGVRAARDVVRLADGLAESPLESLARLCLLQAGLPSPTLQAWVQTGQGRFRVDMLVAAERVVVEADGMVKYALAADDGSKGNALTREKRREESLSRAGFVVVRLTWDDVVNHPAESAQRVRHALAAAVRR